MAEPIPAYPYPDVERMLDPELTVGADPSAIVEPEFSEVYEQVFFRAGRWFSRIRMTAQETFAGLERASIRLTDERPVQVVMGVGIAAAALGVGLRVWRSHHE